MTANSSSRRLLSPPSASTSALRLQLWRCDSLLSASLCTPRPRFCASLLSFAVFPFSSTETHLLLHFMSFIRDAHSPVIEFLLEFLVESRKAGSEITKTTNQRTRALA